MRHPPAYSGDGVLVHAADADATEAVYERDDVTAAVSAAAVFATPAVNYRDAVSIAVNEPVVFRVSGFAVSRLRMNVLIFVENSTWIRSIV